MRRGADVLCGGRDRAARSAVRGGADGGHRRSGRDLRRGRRRLAPAPPGRALARAGACRRAVAGRRCALAACRDGLVADWGQVCDEVARTPTGRAWRRTSRDVRGRSAAAAVRRGWAASATGAGDRRPGRALLCAMRRARLAGVLRERGHGAGRSFVCGLCASEWRSLAWSARRVASPGSRRCRCSVTETCRPCDSTRARRAGSMSRPWTCRWTATPRSVVDDLATMPLDLWAAGQGYTRPRPNLLRV